MGWPCPGRLVVLSQSSRRQLPTKMNLSVIFLVLVAAVAGGANTVGSDRDVCDEAKSWCTSQCQTLPREGTCSAKCNLFVTRTYTCGDLDVKVLPQPMLGYVDIPEQLA